MQKLGSFTTRTWQWLYRLYGVRTNVSLGTHVHVGIGSILASFRGLCVGDNTYIGKYCTIVCDGEIGRNVMLANNVGLIGRYDHDFRVIGKSIRHSPWVGDPGYRGAGSELKLFIGDDVWIGYGAIVLSGVTVSRGAVIAAGSVVTRNVNPYAIVAGNPARQISMRFSPDEVIQHERLLAASE